MGRGHQGSRNPPRVTRAEPPHITKAKQCRISTCRTASWQKTIPNSELAILPIDGYHAAGTDPDNTARVTLDFLARHS
jgi:hypothetical protein